MRLSRKKTVAVAAALSVAICLLILSRFTTVTRQSMAALLAKGELTQLQSEATDHQSAAAINTMLGRPDLNNGLQHLPMPSLDCDTEGTQAVVNGRLWVLEHSRSSRVVMFNENHYVAASRAFVRSILGELREEGFTDIGFETFRTASENGSAIYSPASGYYSVEPNFAALVREAIDLGYHVFGYEHAPILSLVAPVAKVIGAREQGQAENLSSILAAAPATRKFVIFAGWAHIAETEMPISDTQSIAWMASRLKHLTGIDPLTIDLISCGYPASEFDANGRVYLEHSGTTRIVGPYAGAVDAQVRLAVPAKPDDAGFYRRTLGQYVLIDSSLRKTKNSVLIQAFRLPRSSDDVAFDRVLLRPEDQLGLYLPPGNYEVISTVEDGSVVGRAQAIVH